MSTLNVNAIDKESGSTLTLGGAGTKVELHANATSDGFSDEGMKNDIAILGFKVAANGSLSKYNLVDQSIDSFQDSSGIDASASTNELYDNEAKYWSGGQIASQSFTSTGSDQSWTVPTGVSSVTFKCWGSSSESASSSSSGDENEAGYSVGTLATSSGTAYRIIVGNASGYGGSYQSYSQNYSGGLSGVFTGTGAWSATSTSDQATAVIIAGGAGAESYGATGGGAPFAGGAGGGNTGEDGHTNVAYLDAATGGTQTAVGTGSTGSGGSSPYTPQVMQGGQAHDTFYSGSARGGSGGAGYYGGGGGSQYSTIANGGAGGSGFVHSSMTDAQTYPYGSASDRFDGGTGNADLAWTDSDRPTGVGKSGNSGGIVVKYQTFHDLTLVSTASSASAAPNKADIVLTYTNGAGTATVNTDIKAYASRDNGATWTQATLSSEGTTGGHEILSAHNIDISSQPSGTSMRYKIETTNQSASKQTRIQAVSLGWS